MSKVKATPAESTAPKSKSATKKKYVAKTVLTEVTVDSFLNRVEDLHQRADAFRLVELMKTTTGELPRMWGPAIVGFGEYHYKYASGHEGDCCAIGFSPRKGTLSLYIMPSLDKHVKLLAKLGKYKTGKVCLYIKRLADIDEAVLTDLVQACWKEMAPLCKPTPGRLSSLLSGGDPVFHRQQIVQQIHSPRRCPLLLLH